MITYGPSRMRDKSVRRAALLLSILTLTGCTFVHETLRLPGRAVRSVTRTQSPYDPVIVQLASQRFADEFLSRTTAALDEYARRVGTPEARGQALNWKLPVASAAVAIVSAPNPTANLLDLIALTVLTRMAVEELQAGAADPAALQPWVDVSRALETNSWSLADGILGPEQRGELQSAIERWWAAHADARSTFFARPQELTSLVRLTEERIARPTSVYSLFGLDPTAGLDPAVREVTRSRLFAERALYAAQRMPFLLRWHLELITDQTLRQPQVTAALASAPQLADSADRLSRAAESVGLVAAGLPDRIAAEREATLAALTAHEGRLRELSAEISRTLAVGGNTLAAGEKMSTSLNATLVTFDALMRRFGVGEPGANTARSTDAPPFNVLDYAHTAEQLTVMAQEFSALIRDAGGALDSPALTQRLEAVAAATARAKADAKSVLNYAFVLGAGLVLFTFACALAYRRLGRGATGRTGTGAEKVQPPAT